MNTSRLIGVHNVAPKTPQRLHINKKNSKNAIVDRLSYSAYQKCLRASKDIQNTALLQECIEECLYASNFICSDDSY